MSLERYAVYYVPPKTSALAAFGRDWLGVDVETGTNLDPTPIVGIPLERQRALIAEPQRYGFHGSLKPPFSLATNFTANGLLFATQLLAKGIKPIEIPPLELAFIGKFLALSPVSSSAQLENLAASCVRALEGFRAHRTEQELAEYRQSKLTVHQEQMLDNWGYPYVLEEFRFHITLTGRIDDEKERNLVMKAAAERCADFVGKPLIIDEFTICKQAGLDRPMRVFQRIKLGHG